MQFNKWIYEFVKIKEYSTMSLFKCIKHFKRYLMEVPNIVLKNSEIEVLSTEDLSVFETKKQSATGKKIVATHSGAFHADEVLALTMVKYIKEFRDMWIIRSRNMNILKQADIVCDVGGVHDPATNRFDHHMKEFNINFDDIKSIKMSSAGLVYKHHGREIISNILKQWNAYDNTNLDLVYDKLYVNFICYVDANDNGINQYSSEVKAAYPDNTSYHNRVGRLNPGWNEPDMDQSTQFKLAMDVAEGEFLDQLKFVAKSFLPAYSIVKKAVDNRLKVHESGKIIHVTPFCPWKEHLHNIEAKENLGDQIAFAILDAGREGFRVNTIPLTPGNFKFRKGLLEQWRGVSHEELVKISGIEDIVFVHSSGFIGGAKSYESALKMAEMSLNN